MSSTETNRWNQLPIRKILNILGPFIGLLVVIGLFSLHPDVRTLLFDQFNWKLILTQTVIVAICAMGMTMIIIGGAIDLSVGSVVALTSVIGAILVKQGASPWTVGFVTIMSGTLVSAFNGLVITTLRMTPFIVTLGMMGIARGVAKWIARNETVFYDASQPNAQAIAALMKDPDPLGWALSPGIIITFILTLLMIVILRRTVFGRHIFAIGSNEDSARLCGIRTRLMRVAIFMASGVFVGIAGLMQLSRLRQGDCTSSVALELDVIAAVVIGGASLSGGTGSILGSVIGALIMAVLRNFSQQAGWPTYVQEIIIGAVIIIAVALDRFRHGKTS